jgi:hypothetical protein
MKKTETKKLALLSLKAAWQRRTGSRLSLAPYHQQHQRLFLYHLAARLLASENRRARDMRRQKARLVRSF